ncbi:MAG: iron-containing alcohol dehydrogenase [Candidatus Brockarchaeota archaeon]|nr:iron-containing alcohol dehydrogenase [Candidatus Brockarchaeota archaeon]
MSVLTDEVKTAEKLLREWKGESYIFGEGVLDKVGSLAGEYGDNALVVASSANPWIRKPLASVSDSLKGQGVKHDVVLGSRPNSPLADLYRIAYHAALYRPKSIIALGGGSTIDAVKAASVLATYSPAEVSRTLGVSWDKACTIEPYFGTGLVTMMKKATGRDIMPVIAVQTASGSASHLTKYSNITDPVAGQKKLIVDEAIVPKKAVFDYLTTLGAPRDLTVDGGLDGISHIWEVFMGATGKDYYGRIKEIAQIGIRLIVNSLRQAVERNDLKARVALGLGTDLGGYAIMIGGTSGPHLGSFSLVDVLTHGRACAILNPYYTVFFADRIEDQLTTIAPILRDAGLISEDPHVLKGRKLAETVAKGFLSFYRSLGVPTTLKEAGASRLHLERMMLAAKDPQLKMKLLNMPIPLDPERGDIERYMRGILEAAFTGDLSLISSMRP